MKCYTGKEKLNARLNTIITPYRELFNNSIPINEQYWTLAGSILNEKGKINKDSEINQLLSENLISKSQFFGVDQNKEIIQSNSNNMKEVNWIHNTLKDAILNAIQNNSFNPAIINIDHVSMPKQACKDFKDIFKILTLIKKKNLLVILNTLTTNPYNNESCDPNSIVDILNSDQFFSHYLKTGNWNTLNKHYNYSGSGNTKKSKLTTLIFWR